MHRRLKRLQNVLARHGEKLTAKCEMKTKTWDCAPRAGAQESPPNTLSMRTLLRVSFFHSAAVIGFLCATAQAFSGQSANQAQVRVGTEEGALRGSDHRVWQDAIEYAAGR